MATTLGTVSYTLGLGTAGLVLSSVLTKSFHGYALLAAAGGLWYVGSALLAYVSFGRADLGPDDGDRPALPLHHAIAAVARGMVAGLGHLAARPAAGYPMIAQGVFRILYGGLAMATMLLYRQYFYPGNPTAALAGLTQVVAAGGIGSLLAAFLTPPITRRIGGWRWVTGLIASVGVFVLALGLPFIPVLLVLATFFINIATQGTKIVVDTAIQQECTDDYRGRVFSVNDTIFNGFFVIGLFIAALTLPDTGRSVPAILLISTGNLALAGWFGMAASRVAARPRTNLVTSGAR
jgi:hypothetical protein